MRAELEKLIEKYVQALKDTVNPDRFDKWSDLGFSEPPKGFDSVQQYLEDPHNMELDEEAQVRRLMLGDFLGELRTLWEASDG